MEIKARNDPGGDRIRECLGVDKGELYRRIEADEILLFGNREVRRSLTSPPVPGRGAQSVQA